MTDRDKNVFMSKLAEQAERYEGKWRVFNAIGGLLWVRIRELM